MDKYYAFYVKKNEECCTSFSGLDKEEKDMVFHILDNLEIDYDLYSFIKEKRFNQNEDNKSICKLTNYGVNPDTIGLILSEFIEFVCEFKGHKIGVGEALIRRFIKDKVIY